MQTDRQTKMTKAFRLIKEMTLRGKRSRSEVKDVMVQINLMLLAIKGKQAITDRK